MNTIQKKYLVIMLCSCLGLVISSFLLMREPAEMIQAEKSVELNQKEKEAQKLIEQPKISPFEDIQNVRFYLSKNNPLSKSYVPNDLVQLKVLTLREEKLRNEANVALERMFADAKEAGYPLLVVSAYRSYEYQKKLYDQYLKKSDAKELEFIDDLPGKSEHQLGLAVDISDARMEYVLEENFENSKTYQWLIKKSYQYGFILRYPKNLEGVTGYHFHPWHFRYIGLELAKEIHEKQITFDEFVLKNS